MTIYDTTRTESAEVGMVAQKPNPFPKSFFDNAVHDPCIPGLARNTAKLEEIVESSLRGAALWAEVKDRLREPGTGCELG
ncbi:hypothetical protein IE00_11980 [Paracoccus sp. SM22M-07]|nr:hypothetical protein IE00_11980 [Paracoccus sp. SM22M-07]